MTAPTRIIRLTFYRIMPGEYRAPARNNVTYYIDAKADVCSGCHHGHEFWQVSMTGDFGTIKNVARAPKLKDAKAIANRHAIAAGHIDGPRDDD